MGCNLWNAFSDFSPTCCMNKQQQVKVMIHDKHESPCQSKHLYITTWTTRSMYNKHYLLMGQLQMVSDRANKPPQNKFLYVLILYDRAARPRPHATFSSRRCVALPDDLLIQVSQPIRGLHVIDTSRSWGRPWKNISALLFAACCAGQDSHMHVAGTYEMHENLHRTKFPTIQ